MLLAPHSVSWQAADLASKDVPLGEWTSNASKICPHWHSSKKQEWLIGSLHHSSARSRGFPLALSLTNRTEDIDTSDRF
jgi:hypothetical protein